MMIMLQAKFLANVPWLYHTIKISFILFLSIYLDGTITEVFSHFCSWLTGSMLPIEEIVTWSKGVGAKVLVDACQSVPHMPVDVQKLGADFLVASSHKVFYY